MEKENGPRPSAPNEPSARKSCENVIFLETLADMRTGFSAKTRRRRGGEAAFVGLSLGAESKPVMLRAPWPTAAPRGPYLYGWTAFVQPACYDFTHERHRIVSGKKTFNIVNNLAT